ncbi:hypothetical protein NPIL_98531 [Nephila pilipes]|uniref:Uncharacterized protein n=1 Tax=Nephila pilipes TaxID=299642 RepID=A0A8X6P6F5_NEPPI|nr:hypothetical protein NPIL_98531 [Nephila pilipes]
MRGSTLQLQKKTFLQRFLRDVVSAFYNEVMVCKNKIFNMKNPNNLEILRNFLLCDINDDEDIVLDESDAYEEEHISEREDDLESE